MVQQTKTVKYNHAEALSLSEEKRQLARSLEQKWRQAERESQELKKLLQQNDEGEQAWVLHLPVSLLPERKPSGRKINWKKLVIETISYYDMPMTTELLYHKLLLRYNYIPVNRQYVIRGISSALHYLYERDGVFFRQKDEGSRGFIYGHKWFFNHQLQVKPVYLRRLRLEEGEIEGEENKSAASGIKETV